MSPLAATATSTAIRHDESAGPPSPQKAAVAQQLLSRCASQGEAVISVQILQEFYVTVTRKLAPPLTHTEAEDVVRELSHLPTVDSDANLVLDAIAASYRYRMSFWDGLIVQAALRAGATVLYSEDLQHGQLFESLTVQNPFV